MGSKGNYIFLQKQEFIFFVEILQNCTFLNFLLKMQSTLFLCFLNFLLKYGEINVTFSCKILHFFVQNMVINIRKLHFSRAYRAWTYGPHVEVTQLHLRSNLGANLIQIHTGPKVARSGNPTSCTQVYVSINDRRSTCTRVSFLTEGRRGDVWSFGPYVGTCAFFKRGLRIDYKE